ncbi:glutaredoxin family protein [Marisediminicola sp. LYQ134]|uniref:glutaredoxin family protein n=1 Tax=unclassified Marisediminicola TaxID=2618316 RepID=UPI0039831F10
MSSVTLTLLTRPGCHLCDTAREIVTLVVDGVAERDPDRDIRVVEKSIDGDADLTAAYSDQVPVILIDDRVHTYWRVDSARLTTALLEA